MMKKQKTIAWMLAICSILVSSTFMMGTKIQYLKNSYGIVLMIYTMISLLIAILLTVKVSLPKSITNVNTLVLYVLFLLGLGYSYQNQSWFALILSFIILIAVILIVIVVALIRTRKSYKNGKYYFAEKKNNKTLKILEYNSLGLAYKKYLARSIWNALWDVLLLLS